MKALGPAAVIALTLAATSLAYAEGPAPERAAEPTPAPEPAAEAKEPGLPLRPAKPLVLAPSASPTPWPFKIAFALLAAAGGYFAWRRRRDRVSGAAGARPEIRIVAKASLGMRGEVALVEAGGMRLLVGATSGSIQTLAVLPDADDAREEQPEEPVEERRAPLSALSILEGRPRALAVASAARYAERAADAGERKPKASTKKSAPVEGQARGLLLALGSKR